MFGATVIERSVLGILGMVLLHGCGPVQPAFLGRSHPHEEYRNGLDKAGLVGTALGKDWLRASEDALKDTAVVVTPFMESAYVPAEKPVALGYRILARRGEKIRISAEVTSAAPTRLFIDVYELGRSPEKFDHVVSAEDEPLVEFTARRNTTFVVRVQPELLRSARITVTILAGASLEFPVVGHDSRSIRSFFGDGRDGGKRKHEGVEAFAPKGTPLISVSKGMARAANNKLGGKVVWVYDEQNKLNLYYAHLDSQYVTGLKQVQVGDTIGTVGNTGNASHTPPHLHFGIYSRGEGAVDPLPFLNTPSQTPPPILADTELLEIPARIAVKSADLHISPAPKSVVLSSLPLYTYVEVVAAAGSWYRIRQGAITGYVQARHVVRLDKSVERIEVSRPQPLMDAPVAGAAPIRELNSGERVELLAVIGPFQNVRTAENEFGWIVQE